MTDDYRRGRAAVGRTDCSGPSAAGLQYHARTFVALDGFRGIAALCVAFGHGRFLVAGAPTPFFAESYLAVDFFFVLSGFVLEHAYGGALRSGMAPGRFMLLRLIRLYPLYGLALLLSGLLAVVQQVYGPAGAPAPLGDWLSGLLLIPSPASPDFLFPLNIPAWSLFFELLANLAFALAGRWLRTGAVAAICASSVLLLVMANGFGWLGFGGAGGGMNVGVDWASIGGGGVRVTFSFFAGVLLYRLRQQQPRPVRVPLIVLVAILLAVLAAYPISGYQVEFDLVATLAVFPGLVFLGAHVVPGKRTSVVLHWLGAVSFGVYVLQMLCLHGGAVGVGDQRWRALSWHSALGCHRRRRNAGRHGGRARRLLRPADPTAPEIGDPVLNA
ncbi:MAG: acyltransferase [Aliidongia sp.]